MRIIPAIDLIDGKCVRLSKGDYATQKTYNEHPLEVAKEFEAHGIEYLHLVDLDGAKSKHIVNHKVLEDIASKTSLKIDFGGGLKSDEDLKIAFESGAHQVTGGSIAVKEPGVFEQWIETYGSEKIILGAGLDVYSTEPINLNNPLLKNKRIILSPHTAALTNECKIRMGKETARNIINFFEKKINKNMLVNL